MPNMVVEKEWVGHMMVDLERPDIVRATAEDGTVHVLEPTGHPFDDAIEYIALTIADGVCTPDQIRLVHGLVMPHAKQLRAHAWVERLDKLDANGCGQIAQSAKLDGKVMFYLLNTQAFIHLFNPIHAKQYSPYDAMHNNLKHKTRGPWDSAYFYLAMLHGLQSRKE